MSRILSARLLERMLSWVHAYLSARLVERTLTWAHTLLSARLVKLTRKVVKCDFLKIIFKHCVNTEIRMRKLSALFWMKMKAAGIGIRRQENGKIYSSSWSHCTFPCHWWGVGRGFGIWIVTITIVVSQDFLQNKSKQKMKTFILGLLMHQTGMEEWIHSFISPSI